MGARRNWDRAKTQPKAYDQSGLTAPPVEEKPPLALSAERQARIERNVRRRLGKS